MKKIMIFLLTFLLISTFAFAQSASERKEFATKFEQNLLLQGLDVAARAVGKDCSTFSLSYFLMGRPLVYQLINIPTFMESLKAQGFKRVHFTDGYDSSWNYKIP